MKKNTLKVVLWVCALLLLVLAIAFPKANWAYIVEAVLAVAIMGILAFTANEKHNAVKVVLIAFIVFMVLSWIIPAAYYSGQYVDQGRAQMGLFDMFNYALTSISYFGYITLFIILVGGFYGILYKIPAYRTFLDRIVGVFEGKEEFFLSLMVVVIALLVSFCGLHLGMALFIPLIVAVVLLMGYDKITAGFVTVGGICAGLIGTTFASSNISVLTQSLSLNLNYQIWVRLVILLAAIAVVIFNMIVYVRRSMVKVKAVKKEAKVEVTVEKIEKPAKKTTKKKTTTKKSSKKKNNNKAALKEEKVIILTETESKDLTSDYVPKATGKNHSVWPFVVSFALLFVLVVLAFVSWDAEGIGIKLFTDMTNSVTKFELFKFPIFSKVLGTVNAFGAWTLADMFVPLALMVLLLVLIYKVKLDDVLDGFVSGAKKALGPAFISVMVYAILVLVTYHPFQLVVFNALLSLNKGFNILTTTVIAILAGLFNADISYTFQSILPYYVTKVTNLKDFSIVGIIFTSMYGLTMLVAPTSLVLMGTLSYLKVPYKDWLKAIWKLLLELFVILLIVFILLTVL